MSECYSFVVNGVPCSTEEEKPLLRYLRDELRLTSVKDGCSEGACGTCTILVDGKAVKACVLSTKRAAGKEIVTVEGLSEAEREAFVYAFGAVGAVQCGFCIPGMVMAGKALLDQNPNPSEAEIKKAIRGNVCRCTGYKKIIEGIALAGAILRGEASVDPALEEGEDYGVGARAFRTDVRDKVLGRGEYCDDLYLDGMAHASAVRSQYPRARVLDIDPSAALALPGVLAVLTADDVPHNKVGHLQQDWDVMIAKGDITRCVGDAICLVVAENETVLKQAKELVKVDYEPLEPVRTIQEARAADAPILHPGGNLCQQRHVTRGDARAALAQSKYVVTQSYRTPFTEHAFLEPECAVAFPYKDGVKVYTSDQGVYDTRKEISIMLGWEPERIVVENKLVGGGFGGKEDVSVQHLAVLAALRVNRPVKAKLTRQESINFHPKRHYMEGTFTLGCDENGIFTGLDCEIHFDTGAYASLCGPVLERACTHSVGPYCYQNTDIRGFGWYTNNPPAGAFRGFGVCQSEFALESNINLLAEKVGISPWEIRFRNAIEPGKALPNGQIADCSTALKETLLAVKDVYEQNADHAGIACAMKNSGVGVGLPDKGRCRLAVRNGVVELYSAASDIGQGCATVFLQMLAEATGLPLEKLPQPQHLHGPGFRHHLRFPPDPDHRRGGAHGRRRAQGRSGRGGRGLVRPGGAGVQRRVFRSHRQVGGRQAQSQEPRGLRLRHPCGDSGRRGPGEGGLCRPRLGQGGQPHLHSGSDRGGRAHGPGLRPHRGLPPQGLRAPGQIRHPGADAGRPDSRHPRHLCGEGGAAPLRLRGQGHRRDRHHPHRSGGPGGLLRP